MSMRLRRGATKMWQENREEGVSLKERVSRVNEKTRESPEKVRSQAGTVGLLGKGRAEAKSMSWLRGVLSLNPTCQP